MNRMTPRRRAVCIVPILVGLALPAIAGTNLKDLAIPGEPAFVEVARDILGIRVAIDPSLPAGNGLFDDAARVPSFGPRTVEHLLARLDADMQALRGMDWRAWDIDRQIDWRWVYAIAEEARLQLAAEKLYRHRPASWLEPLANTYIAYLTYAPERADLRARLTAAIPGMVEEMRRVCVALTARDVATAGGIADGILVTLAAEAPGHERDAAIEALSGYIEEIEAKTGLPEFAVIGETGVEERLRRAMLLPWSARQLLAIAQRELTEADARLAQLRPELSAAADPTPAQLELADRLDQETVNALYDTVTDSFRRFLDGAGILTIPAGVGPIRARPTPEAMIPLTGDGGSMNPPPPFGDSNIGWWNVEHCTEDWTQETRLRRIVSAQEPWRTGMGPYAAHEGVPGHHLQLSIARLHPNPLRKVLADGAFVEGWAMYAEEMFWRAGGLGESADAEYRTIASWRGRIRRVFYGVHVECGDWSLGDAADFRHAARRGGGKIDEDVLRTLNWPGQLISYFAGKMQILELKEAYRARRGDAYSEREFHDALLAEGSIPVALIRVKLLGEPVPEPVAPATVP